MHKITRLICLQLFACKLANIRKPRSVRKYTQIQGMTYSPRSAAIQVQTVMLWMTTMSIQGKMRIATIFIRVGVIFIALDEVSITEDGNGKGDNLGVGDGV